MKRSLTHGAGYMVIDHRDSPGLTPADVAGVPGAIAVPGGEMLERDVLQCRHCMRQVVLHPLRTRPRGYCAKCDHYICDDPICQKECAPVGQLVDTVLEHGLLFSGQPDHPHATPTIILTDAWKA